MTLVEDVAQATLIFSNLEDNTSIYNSSTTYNLGDIVNYNNYIYKSVSDSNEASPLNLEKWVYWDNINNRAFPIPFGNNKIRLFDDYNIDTVSSRDGNIKLEFNSNLSTFVGLYNIIGDSIKIEVLDEVDTILFVESKELLDNPIWDYIDYYYWEDIDKLNYIEFIIPRIYSGKIKIELIGNITSIGTLEIGTLKSLGCTLVNAKYSYTGENKASIDSATGIKYYKDAIRGGTSNISCEIFVRTIDELNLFTSLLREYENKNVTFLVDDRDNKRIQMFRIRGRVTRFSTSLTNTEHIYQLDIDSI